MMHDAIRARLLSWDIYVVGDRALAAGQSHRSIAASAFDAGAKVYQLREKGTVPDDDLLPDARAIASLARSAGVTFIVNDRIDLAARCGAHGVHLGQDDAPVAEARRALGPDAIIGFSTHSAAQVESALDLALDPATRLDYLSIGPLFPTTSKPDAEPVVPREVIASLRPRIPVPIVGIGGITVERIPVVLEAGCDVAAVISAAMAPSTLGIARKVRELVRAFLAARGGGITR